MCYCPEGDLDSVFRIGPVVQDKSRTIIANFIASTKRDSVFLAKKSLKGGRFAVFEDLTSKQYNLLTLVKKKYGNTKAWSSSGKVFYWDAVRNKKVLVKSKDDL